MASPRFEPRNFRTEDRCPIPYTTVSLGKFCKKIKNVYIQGQKCPKILGGKFKSRKIQKCKVLYSQLICYSIKKSSTFDMFSIITYSALASLFHNKSSTTPNIYILFVHSDSHRSTVKPIIDLSFPKKLETHKFGNF